MSARLSLSTTVDVVKSNLIAGLSTKCTSVYVAEITSEIVGYVSCHWIPFLLFKGGEGYVTELFVRPNFAGRGIGTILLRLVEEEAKDRGCSRLSLLNGQDRKSYELGFYLKRGWTEREKMRNFILPIANTRLDSETSN
ncbi:MAG: GNAT family N-acetyltransferase [Pirellulaceae bacterium]